jgi:hypothetical protein
VPDFARKQLHPKEVDRFIRTHVENTVPNSSISVPFYMGFRQYLVLDTAEVVLKDHNAVSMHAVLPGHSASAPLIKLNSPPILPHLIDRNALEKRIDNWLDAVIKEPDSELPGHCFPEDHEHWQRTVLTIICQYYQRTLHKQETVGPAPFEVLREALKLTVLNHVMCYSIYIPEEEVEWLHGQLQGSYPYDADKPVCPRLANKVIKSMLLKSLIRLTQCVLMTLNRLLRTKGEERLWDPLFCTVFLCLIVVGNFQVSCLERAEIGLSNHDNSFVKSDAIAAIEEMEREFSLHLVPLFHARFGTNRKATGRGKMFNPLGRDRTAASWLADEVALATQTYGMFPPSCIETKLQMLMGVKAITSLARETSHIMT